MHCLLRVDIIGLIFLALSTLLSCWDGERDCDSNSATDFETIRWLPSVADCDMVAALSTHS